MNTQQTIRYPNALATKKQTYFIHQLGGGDVRKIQPTMTRAEASIMIRVLKARSVQNNVLALPAPTATIPTPSIPNKVSTHVVKVAAPKSSKKTAVAVTPNKAATDMITLATKMISIATQLLKIANQSSTASTALAVIKPTKSKRRRKHPYQKRDAEYWHPDNVKARMAKLRAARTVKNVLAFYTTPRQIAA